MIRLKVAKALLGLAVTLTLLAPLVNGALVLPQDASIMMRLKDMYIAKVPALATWNTSVDCTLWSRTQCDSNRIAKIDFGGTYVGGPLPEFITGLLGLRLIYADGSGWTGSLPDSFSVLTKLQLIRMGGNDLTGSLPSNWSTLRSLYRLGLGNNDLTGAVPTTWTTFNLQEFYADAAGLSGEFPTIVCRWSALQLLRIGGNPWVGPIPTCIGDQNTKLTRLNLDNCGPTMTGSIPANLGNLALLALMYLNGNSLTGPIPESISGMRSLKAMFLSGNQITGPLPQSMGALTALTQWTMEFNQIDGTIPDTIGNMTNVQRILLDNNRLTGTIPASIGRLKNLTILLLEGNKLHGPVPPEIPAGCTSLVQFNVESNFLSGVPPGGFASPRIATGQVNYRSNIFSGVPRFTFLNGSRFCPPFWPNSWVHSSVAFNCFRGVNATGCKDNDAELRSNMHSDSVCSRACGAYNPSGPCGGNGYCLPSYTCECFPGYTPAVVNNVSTCVAMIARKSSMGAKGGATLAKNSLGSGDSTGFMLSVDSKSSTLDPLAAGEALPAQIVSTVTQASAEVVLGTPGTCDLGNDTVCPIDVDCLDTGGLSGCACLSGEVTSPSCVYSKVCLDQKECPILAKCLYKNGKTTCSCKPGYRPLMAAIEPNEAHFQYCVKTKCQNAEPFLGFNCFNVEKS